jgi:outer membrane protein OmpA-like peptidoglycan-associated protein
LDENSISQAIILADANLGINGISLLELGFVPTFYAFQYVDLSANMSLKISSEFSLDIGLTLDIGVGGDLSKASSQDILQSQEDSELRRSFKSSSSVAVESNSEQAVYVGANSTTVKMDLTKGCYSRRHKFAEDLRQVSEVKRVDQLIVNRNATVQNQSDLGVHLSYSQGFLAIGFTPKRTVDYAIFRIDKPANATGVDIDAGLNFVLAPSDFEGSVEAAYVTMDGGITTGFESNSYYETSSVPGTATPHVFAVYFAFDGKSIDSGYEVDGVDNAARLVHMKALINILLNDNSLNIEIAGHTDTVDDPAYNNPLGQTRADVLEAWLIEQGAPKGQIITKTLGENEANTAGDAPTVPNEDRRRAEITIISDASYIFLEQGLLDAATVDAAEVTTSIVDDTNDYIYIHAAEVTPDTKVDGTLTDGDAVIVLSSGMVNMDVNSISGSSIESNLNAQGYSGLEVFNDVAYVANEKLRVSYTALSESAEEVKMEKSSNSSSSGSSSSNTEESMELGVSQTASTYSQKDSKSKNKNKNWNLDASLDARVASRFSFSIEGNSSMSARMIALPAPAEFITLLVENANTP